MRGHISVSRKGRDWYLSSEGEELRALAYQIDEIVRARRSRVDALPFNWFFQVGNFIVLAGILTFGRMPALSSGLIIAGAMLIASWLSLLAHSLLYPGLVLNFPHEAGFLSRNRDALVLLGVGTLIGGVVQFALSLLFGTP